MPRGPLVAGIEVPAEVLRKAVVMAKSTGLFLYFDSLPEVIRRVAMMYVRYPSAVFAFRHDDLRCVGKKSTEQGSCLPSHGTVKPTAPTLDFTLF